MAELTFWLEISEVAYGHDYGSFIITWCSEEGEGSSVGEFEYTAASLEAADDDDRETVVAELAAQDTEGVARGEGKRFVWRTHKLASAALKAIKAALKRDKNREKPWPEWAIKAQAAGWKPPKAWSP